MLIDQMLVFTDNKAIRATGNSETVDVMPFIGKGADVTVSVAVTEAYPAEAAVTISVQDSGDGAAFTGRGEVSAPAGILQKGGVFSFSLPRSVAGPKVRLAYAVTGAPATGKLWAGVTRDALEAMEAGQYQNAGKTAL